MLKRASLIAVSIFLALTLAGCGQSAQTLEETQPPEETQNQDETEKEQAPQAQSTEKEKDTASEEQPTTDDKEQGEQSMIIEANYDGIEVASNGARVSVHDPSIKVFDGRYYIYGSHMTGAVSKDMQRWTYLGNEYSAYNTLFGGLFDEGSKAFDYAGDYGNDTYAVWAEDVIYIEEMQQYVMYYCTSSTYIKSNLCYATSDSPKGPFIWQGALLYSGFTASDIEKTDVYDTVTKEYAAEHYLKLSGEYNNQDWPNCIDPAPFYDEDGRLWMTYGSWSGGIFLLELDPTTGLVIHPEEDLENNVDPYFGKRLLGGGHKSIEGPYIQYDKEAGYYYLYVSYGGLERTGGYQIRVYRSETVDGDYVDMNDKVHTSKYNHSYFGLKLSGNYYLPSVKTAYMATGGQSTFTDEDGKRYICYHSRFDGGTEHHEPCVKQIFINKEGWPVLAPYTTKGETISVTGYDKAQLIGDYYFINQGLGIDPMIAEPVMISLNEDGTLSGSYEGTWEFDEGTYFMRLSYEDTEYSGVFCQMSDQAGTEVMTFSAVGANESIWGVKY